MKYIHTVFAGITTIAFVVVFLFQPNFAFASGIAFDNGVLGTFTSGTSKTIAAFAVTTSNPYLLVFFTTEQGTDIVTGVTFNGVAMTRLLGYDTGNAIGGSPHWSYIYGIAAGGTHDIVLSSSASSNWDVGAVSYSGVNQSTPLDGTASGDPWGGLAGTSNSKSFTTSVNNSWVITSILLGSSPVPVAGAGTTARVTGAPDYGFGIGDFGPVTPAGAHSSGWTYTSSASSMVALALQPAGGSIVTPPPFIYFPPFIGN